jgi:UDP-GlcNAc:undecaprenyl-phosphate GlcNAc-1-phosphate transferase
MTILLAFVLALGLSYLGTRLLLRRRPARGFVDIPNERSSHDRPKPRFGGIAIVGAFLTTFAAACVWVLPLREFIPLAVGSGVLFAAGLVDDWRGLGVGARLAVQALAAGVALASGTVLDHVALPVVGTVSFGWFAYPLTLVIFLASINFYNFVDGIDGLAAGGAFIAGGFLAVIASMAGETAVAVASAITSGCALGFLQYNFPPSRLFMGDGGSTFFGYCFAYHAIAGSSSSPGVPVFVPVLLLSSLYLDAGLTIVRRVVRGEKVFRPHRTHYYQRLLQLGFNHKQVTLLEYLVLVLLGASALLYVKAGELFAPVMSAVWVALFTLSILKIHALERGGRLFWERRLVFLIATDLTAIVAAYLGAYFLRMNFQFTQAEGMAVLRALPIVVVVRTACFFKYGLYRSMWRYTSMADVVRVIKAVTAGSAIILAAIVLLYRFVAFPRTLFLIEYFLLTSLILGVRFSTRLFHEIGREPQGDAVRRYGVIGAGDEAERLAREIRAHGPSRAVVCFVDDDPRRVGLTVHGVTVEGPGSRLEEICRRHRVDALVYAASGHDESAAAVWLESARAAGVPLERFPGATESREPATIVLDRVSRALGRADSLPSARAVAALRGRRVLLTHGGERFGSSLATLLRALGAIPIVHFDGAHERSRSEAVDGGGVVVGPILTGAPTLVEAAAPHIVVHAVTAEPVGGLNDEEFAWEHLVRETEALSRAVWRVPGCRMVVASVWGQARPGDRIPAVAALMESMLLNRAGVEPAAVVRLPRILPANALSASEAPPPAGYDLLEHEAARLVLEIAAGAYRGIYVPAPGPEIDLATARAAAAPRGDVAPAEALRRTRAGAGPVFPSEHLDECGVDGARRVLSPLFPAADPFRHVAVHAAVEAPQAQREEWLRAVAAQLYTLARTRDEAVQGRNPS